MNNGYISTNPDRLDNAQNDQTPVYVFLVYLITDILLWFCIILYLRYCITRMYLMENHHLSMLSIYISDSVQ